VVDGSKDLAVEVVSSLGEWKSLVELALVDFVVLVVKW